MFDKGFYGHLIVINEIKRLIDPYQEYQRAVIFRLGRVKKGGAVGPGVVFTSIDQSISISISISIGAVGPGIVFAKEPTFVRFPNSIYTRGSGNLPL